MTKYKSVLGIYTSRSAEAGIADLRAAGFASADVSVLLPENLGPKELAAQKATKAPEGTAAGVSSGALIGGELGWLLGIGAFAIPGLGPFIAAGPIMATLAGVGVGGAVGDVTGALIGIGIPEYQPSYMRADCEQVESSLPFIVILRKKSSGPRTSSSVPGRRISRPPRSHLRVQERTRDERANLPEMIDRGARFCGHSLTPHPRPSSREVKTG